MKIYVAWPGMSCMRICTRAWPCHVPGLPLAVRVQHDCLSENCQAHARSSSGSVRNDIFFFACWFQPGVLGLSSLFSMESRPVRSNVWKFFERAENERAECLLCKRKVVHRGGSTSSLKKHLEHCHSADWAKACKTECGGSKSTPDVKPNLLGAMDKFLQRKTCPCWRSGALTNAIVNLIASDLRPINFVNGAGFRRLMQVAEPGYTVPSKTHITTLLQKKYEDGVSRLNSILLRAQGLAFTTDLWTSKATESYMTVTAHQIDEE